MESTLMYISLMFVPIASIIANRPNISKEFLYACVLSSFMGFLLRITKRVSDENVNIKTFLIQFIFSCCVCYFAFLMLLNFNIRDLISYTILGISSFLAAEIVSSFETYGNKGVKIFIREIIKKWIAMDDRDSEDKDKTNDNDVEKKENN